jgi:putative nucleotidyltransferase with HDIG domain
MSTAKKLKPEEQHHDLDEVSPPEPAEEQQRLTKAIDTYFANVTDLARQHIAVPLDLIILHQLPDVTLYLVDTEASQPGRPEYKVFRNKGLYLSQVELDALSENGVNTVYIARTEVPAFTQYVEHLLSELGTISPMADEQKVGILRKSAIHVMSDIYADPSPENIERGVKVVSNFVYVLMRDPRAYQLLLQLSSHDHYTLQHCVGVATNAIILAKKVGVHDEASLIEVGVAGLLHDIGKTKVPKEIINKKGPLDETEWAEMKKHAMYGYEILKDNPNIGMRAKLAVLQHHEDVNGTGYPMGLSQAQVSLFARIVTLCDIYNAITTDRSYSAAKPPYEAFVLIKNKLSHKVDMKLFDAMVMIYGGKPV